MNDIIITITKIFSNTLTPVVTVTYINNEF